MRVRVRMRVRGATGEYCIPSDRGDRQGEGSSQTVHGCDAVVIAAPVQGSHPTITAGGVTAVPV